MNRIYVKAHLEAEFRSSWTRSFCRGGFYLDQISMLRETVDGKTLMTLSVSNPEKNNQPQCLVIKKPIAEVEALLANARKDAKVEACGKIQLDWLDITMNHADVVAEREAEAAARAQKKAGGKLAVSFTGK